MLGRIVLVCTLVGLAGVVLHGGTGALLIAGGLVLGVLTAVIGARR